MMDKGTWRLEKVTLAAIGAILALFLGARLRLLPVPWGIIFLLIVAMVVLASLFWWAFVDRQLLGSNPGLNSTNRRRWLRRAWAVFMLLMLSPLLFWMIGARGLWDAYPAPLIAWILIWHMLMVVLATIWAPLAGGRAVFMRMSARRLPPPAGDDAPKPTRRDVLARAATAAPMIIAGGSLGLAVWQDGRFAVRRITVRLSRLPSRLQGLTITHISDLHLGRLFRPEHLPRLVDAVNRLKSDVLAVTGDIVDHSNDFLPSACDALAQMESRYGRFVIVGNHDLIDSPREVIDYLRQREPFLLMDRMLPLLIGGETVQVAGLFWSRYDAPRGREPGHAGRAEAALSGADRQRFTVALAHHPHAFDPLAARGVDLTLSGHTHGGQLMLTPQGSRAPVGGGSLLFRYIWGEYKRGDSVLCVNAGVGNWFPVRINAPAEIVQIRLI